METPEFELSPEMAQFCGKKKMAGFEIVKKIWAYIDEKELGLPGNEFRCDENLRRLLGVERAHRDVIGAYIMPHCEMKNENKN